MSNVNPPNLPGQPGQSGSPETPPAPPTQPFPAQGSPQVAPTQQFPAQSVQQAPYGGQPGFPGAQPGYAAPPHGGQYPGAGPGPGGPGFGGPGFGGPPKNSNSRLIVMVIAGVVAAAIIGGILMFAFGKKDAEVKQPQLPGVTAPAGSKPTGTSTSPSTASSSPSSGPAAGGGGQPANGKQVDIAQGVKATLPAGWEVDKPVSGGVLVVSKAAAMYLQIQAFSGKKQTNLELCQVLEDAAAKDLGNVQKSACKPGPANGRVQTATGTVSGTYSTSQGSIVLGTIVLAGVRDDGLVTGTQMTYPTKKPPTDDQLKEAVSIWTSVIISQGSAS